MSVKKILAILLLVQIALPAASATYKLTMSGTIDFGEGFYPFDGSKPSPVFTSQTFGNGFTSILDISSSFLSPAASKTEGLLSFDGLSVTGNDTSAAQIDFSMDGIGLNPVNIPVVDEVYGYAQVVKINLSGRYFLKSEENTYAGGRIDLKFFDLTTGQPLQLVDRGNTEIVELWSTSDAAFSTGGLVWCGGKTSGRYNIKEEVELVFTSYFAGPIGFMGAVDGQAGRTDCPPRVPPIDLIADPSQVVNFLPLDTRPLTPVPLPGGMPLLFAGILCMGVLLRRQ